MEPGAVTAVGVWFYSVATDRYLYLLRNDAKHPGVWALPGGKSQHNESLMDTMIRECREELGTWPQCLDIVPLEQFTNDNTGFVYHTFYVPVAAEFQPSLNHEHLGYAWIKSQSWPKPLHPGLWNTVNLHEIQEKISTVQKDYRSAPVL